MRANAMTSKACDLRSESRPAQAGRLQRGGSLRGETLVGRAARSLVIALQHSVTVSGAAKSGLAG